MLQHAVLAARTIVVARSSGADRARLLGYLGVAYGVGFAVGPALGGLLSRHSLQLGSWLATAGSLLSMALVWALLPGGERRRRARLPAALAALAARLPGAGAGGGGDALAPVTCGLRCAPLSPGAGPAARGGRCRSTCARCVPARAAAGQ
jgi:MFS family permease